MEVVVSLAHGGPRFIAKRPPEKKMPVKDSAILGVLILC